MESLVALIVFVGFFVVGSGSIFVRRGVNLFAIVFDNSLVVLFFDLVYLLHRCGVGTDDHGCSNIIDRKAGLGFKCH